MTDGSGAVMQEYGDVTAQADGIEIDCGALMVRIPGEDDTDSQAVASALAAVDRLAEADRMRRDIAFLTFCAQDAGPDSVPAANLRELLALRKLADAVRAERAS